MAARIRAFAGDYAALEYMRQQTDRMMAEKAIELVSAPKTEALVDTLIEFEQRLIDEIGEYTLDDLKAEVIFQSQLSI